MEEVWKDIPNYEGMYQVSNLGRVKSVNYKRTGKEKILKLIENSNKYFRVTLTQKGIGKKFYVHQLVAMVFLNHKVNGKTIVVDHIDYNKKNNCLSNLRLISDRVNSSKTSVKKRSKYVGVHWRNERNKWRSSIVKNNKTFYLGHYKKEYDAFLAYQKKLKEIDAKK